MASSVACELGSKKFSHVVCEGGFQQCHSDSVFIHHSSVGSAILAIYVDDILLTESYTNGIENANDYLMAHFMTKDMEDLDTSLGL